MLAISVPGLMLATSLEPDLVMLDATPEPISPGSLRNSMHDHDAAA